MTATVSRLVTVAIKKIVTGTVSSFSTLVIKRIVETVPVTKMLSFSRN
ncbi:hypothetical protein [Neobacillus cucumis]|nr:hypothetical protein [Neobacillus cucumis]MBM7652634.1 hypothetical protein [Neobacillus cucumis]